MEWELSWTAGSTAKDTSQPHVLLAVCHLSSHLTSLNVLSKLYIRISYSIALGVKWGGYKGLSTASSMEVLALSSSLLFLFPLPQKLIYWDEKWRIWLGQKKKKKQNNNKKNKDPVLLIADLQHNLKSGIFMMHSKRRSSLEARRQVMQWIRLQG